MLEREVSLAAFLVKSGAVKSSLLETLWVSENRKERGTGGRKEKAERP